MKALQNNPYDDDVFTELEKMVAEIGKKAVKMLSDEGGIISIHSTDEDGNAKLEKIITIPRKYDAPYSLVHESTIPVAEKRLRRPNIIVDLLSVHIITTTKQDSSQPRILLIYYPQFRIPAGTSENELLLGISQGEFSSQVNSTYYQMVLEEDETYREFHGVPEFFNDLIPQRTDSICFEYGATKKYQDILVSDDKIFIYPKYLPPFLVNIAYSVTKSLAHQVKLGTHSAKFTINIETPKQPQKLPFSTDARK